MLKFMFAHVPAVLTLQLDECTVGLGMDCRHQEVHIVWHALLRRGKRARSNAHA